MSSPSINILGVTCEVDLTNAGSNLERATVMRYDPSQGWSADVTLKCPWNSRFTVVRGLLGGPYATGRTITYLLPATWPGVPWLYCTSLGDITGLKPSTNQISGWIEYQYALIPAHFSKPPWDAVGGSQANQGDPSGLPFTTTTFRTSAEVFQPPTGCYYYDGGTYDGKPVAESSVGVVRSRVEISMVRHRMPFIPLAESLQNQGFVNDAPVTFANYTFPAGCLLFTGMQVGEPTADPGTGNRCWDVAFGFLGNENLTWNEYLDPSGEWVAINSASDGSGDPPFASVSFADLFGTEF